MDKEKIKENITKFNNVVLSSLLFYIGIGISSLLWKLKNISGNDEKCSGWKEWKGEENLEKMKKLY